MANAVVASLLRRRLRLGEPPPMAWPSGLAVSVSEGKLVVVPVGTERPSLEELLAKVSKANLHGEIDVGPPVGRESW